MNAPRSVNNLPDIQNLTPDIRLPVDNVGIRGLSLRLRIAGQFGNPQTTVATCALGARLSADKRGTHMSRFVEALNAWNGILEENSLRKLLEDLCLRLEASQAMADFRFPLFIKKSTPYGAESELAYNCALKGELKDNELFLTQFLEVPVMTVCPCSMAICTAGAHSQRALVRLRLRMANFVNFEYFIGIAENSASSAIYTLLKREDEKFVTEQAFARPAFVEDVARKAASFLENERDILAFEVEVESMESIHNHNAFATIYGNKGYD